MNILTNSFGPISFLIVFWLIFHHIDVFPFSEIKGNILNNLDQSNGSKNTSDIWSSQMSKTEMLLAQEK